MRWQGAPTQWAFAHQEKQRSQRAVARLNRLRSVFTQWVMAGGQGVLNGPRASDGVANGQLPNLGFTVQSLERLSVLPGQDQQPVVIAADRELSPTEVKPKLKRQYWREQDGHWRIFFDGLVS